MISFVKYRSVCAVFSATLIVLFAAVAIYRIQTRGHAFNYSIDFTGGTQVLLRANQQINSDHIKTILAEHGFSGVNARNFTETECQVRVKDFSDDPQGTAEKVLGVIKEAMPEKEVVLLQNEAVGPGVGEQLRWRFIYAVLIAFVVLLFYIAIRSMSIGFGAGAVVALLHDVFIMVAVFLFLDREITVNFITAILAVLGYSINDTIVIFSRIRKNMHELRNMSIEQIVDISLNQTLKRTLLTSISTGLCVLAMLIFGGEALRDLSIALLVGIVFGTYSSVYIASPIMMLLHKDK